MLKAYLEVPCRRKEQKSRKQTVKIHGTSTTFEMWLYFKVRGKMKGKIRGKKQAKAKNADLVDWLLAIDAGFG